MYKDNFKALLKVSREEAEEDSIEEALKQLLRQLRKILLIYLTRRMFIILKYPSILHPIQFRLPYCPCFTNTKINVDCALELGIKQKEEFEKAWPKGFYTPLK